MIATVIDIAERSTRRAIVPATLGLGAAPASQLENRVRRIVSPAGGRRVRMSRSAATGAFAAAILMTATILFAEVENEAPAPKTAEETPATPAADPSLHALIERMAAYEKAYMPFELKVKTTFRMGEDLTPRERASHLWADGRKHGRLMEHAQLGPGVWRKSERQLINDEAEEGGPTEQFVRDDRLILVQREVDFNGKKTTEVYIENRPDRIRPYTSPEALNGVFCLTTVYPCQLFSEAFGAKEEAIELAWDNGDAKLTFLHGRPERELKLVLWLSRKHDWHPVRLQRYRSADAKEFGDEWEATKFIQVEKQWRVVEGTHRYRSDEKLDAPDPKITHSTDFQVLEAKFGMDVNSRQFEYSIPEDAVVRNFAEREAKPPPPAFTRDVSVTVVDVAGQPIPGASVKISANSSADGYTTDETGVIQPAKAPKDRAIVRIAAEGFRPATWALGAAELRATLVPLSPGVVVDEEGRPLADVKIVNHPIYFLDNGSVQPQPRGLGDESKDWSDAEGRFELQTELTVRRPDSDVLYLAFDSKRERMAIRFLKATEVGERQELVLRPVCQVRASCLLLGMTESPRIWSDVQTPDGQSIASLEPKSELTPEGLRVDFAMRLPEGSYVVRGRKTAHHAGIEIPFTVTAGAKELDLGTTKVPPAGLMALRGKPAPPLEVQFRPGQETTWEKLRGKVVVLDFWGTWCGPCIADMPMLMEIHERFRDQPVAWLSIHTAEPKSFEELDEKIAKLKKDSWEMRDLPFTLVIDQPLGDEGSMGKTIERYGIAEWPTIAVIDQSGNVAGPVRKENLAATITQLLDERK